MITCSATTSPGHCSRIQSGFYPALLTDAGKRAKLTKKVTASMLRDLFVVRGVKRGEKLEELFEKIGLAHNSFDDAKKKYGRLTSEAL